MSPLLKGLPQLQEAPPGPGAGEALGEESLRQKGVQEEDLAHLVDQPGEGPEGFHGVFGEVGFQGEALVVGPGGLEGKGPEKLLPLAQRPPLKEGAKRP